MHSHTRALACTCLFSHLPFVHASWPRSSPFVSALSLSLSLSLSRSLGLSLPLSRSLGPQALAFVTASANELTRSNKITDLVNYLVGEEEDDGSGEKPPPSLPWEWDRVGHDTCANLARDCGAQTLARCVERRAKASLGHGASYCELLKHAHKAACKEFHECRKLPGASGMAASAMAARIVLGSPAYYALRSLTGWLADVAVDCVAWCRGQLDTKHLLSNGWLKAAKYCLGGALCFAFGALVPFLYPHPYIFIGVEQLTANLIADSVVETYLGAVQPS
jgi:hypothetical protein